jgi:DNA-binding NarL/FixJ family response regulator
MKFIKPKKVFLVDDDNMLTEALTDYLTREVPHKVTAFRTGEECLENLSENPDVVVLDFYLNSQNKEAANGMEIIKAIKKNYPGMHVIMLSSQERYGIALQTIQKGAENYVIKDADAFDKIAKLINEM